MDGILSCNPKAVTGRVLVLTAVTTYVAARFVRGFVDEPAETTGLLSGLLVAGTLVGGGLVFGTGLLTVEQDRCKLPAAV